MTMLTNLKTKIGESTMKMGLMVCATVLFIPLWPLAFAQHEGHSGMGPSMPMGSMGPTYDGAQKFALMANESQRAALEKCMNATERVNLLLAQLDDGAHPSNRNGMGPGSDAKTFADREQEFQSKLNLLTEAHNAFGSTLSEAQRKGLERELNKLDHLQAAMDSISLRISQAVMDSNSESLSRHISSDLKSLRKNLEKWQSEHRRIAKEMSITS